METNAHDLDQKRRKLTHEINTWRHRASQRRKLTLLRQRAAKAAA